MNLQTLRIWYFVLYNTTCTRSADSAVGVKSSSQGIYGFIYPIFDKKNYAKFTGFIIANYLICTWIPDESFCNSHHTRQDPFLDEELCNFDIVAWFNFHCVFISPMAGYFDNPWYSFVVCLFVFFHRYAFLSPMISLNGWRYEILMKTKKFRLDGRCATANKNPKNTLFQPAAIFFLRKLTVFFVPPPWSFWTAEDMKFWWKQKCFVSMGRCVTVKTNPKKSFFRPVAIFLNPCHHRFYLYKGTSTSISTANRGLIGGKFLWNCSYERKCKIIPPRTIAFLLSKLYCAEGLC